MLAARRKARSASSYRLGTPGQAPEPVQAGDQVAAGLDLLRGPGDQRLLDRDRLPQRRLRLAISAELFLRVPSPARPRPSPARYAGSSGDSPARASNRSAAWRNDASASCVEPELGPDLADPVRRLGRLAADLRALARLGGELLVEGQGLLQELALELRQVALRGEPVLGDLGVHLVDGPAGQGRPLLGPEPLGLGLGREPPGLGLCRSARRRCSDWSLGRPPS